MISFRISFRPAYNVSIVIFILGLSWPAIAAEWLLTARSPYVKPGKTFELIAIVPDQTARHERLLARIEPSQGGQYADVELREISDLSTPSQRRYTGQWPADIRGVATLLLHDGSSSPILLDATPRAGEPEHEILASMPQAQESQASIRYGSNQGIKLPRTAQSIFEDDIGHDIAAPDTTEWHGERPPLAFHEPVYFVFGGRDPASARFQLSFSYRLFDRQGIVAETLPFTSGLHFAYTHTSLWDLQSESKPFRDTSFRPSFFYRWEFNNPEKRSALTLSSGYEHESNGEDGDDSRSIDTLFLQADVRRELNDKGLYFGITPKLWYYLDKEENPDIYRYRGYGQLGMRLGYKDSWQVATLLRAGSRMDNRSVQVDVTYPLKRRVFSRVGTLLHFQYFQGYGQTMLNYNHSDKAQFRIGLSIVR